MRLRPPSRYAIHQLHNVTIVHTNEGFAVRFVVHFEGDVEGAGLVRLTNFTNWSLIEEDGALKLRAYSLTIL